MKQKRIEAPHFVSLVGEAYNYFAKVEGIRFLTEAEYAGQLKQICLDICGDNGSYTEEYFAVRRGDFNGWWLYGLHQEPEGGRKILFSTNIIEISGRTRLRYGRSDVTEELSNKRMEIAGLDAADRKLTYFDLTKGDFYSLKPATMDGFEGIEKMIDRGQRALIERVAKNMNLPINLWSLAFDPTGNLIRALVNTCKKFPESMDGATVNVGFDDQLSEIKKAAGKIGLRESKRQMISRLLSTASGADRTKLQLSGGFYFDQGVGSIVRLGYQN